MRERPTIEPKFFETYHYADVITAVVEEPVEHLRLWNDFLGDGAVSALVAPYVPESAFHAFIGFVIDRLLYDYTVDCDLDGKKALARRFEEMPDALADLAPFTLPVERALTTRRFDFESFVEWLRSHDKVFADAEPDDIHDYFEDLQLCGPYEDLVARSAREVFFTLFTWRRSQGRLPARLSRRQSGRRRRRHRKPVVHRTSSSSPRARRRRRLGKNYESWRTLSPPRPPRTTRSDDSFPHRSAVAAKSSRCDAAPD